MVAFLAFVGFIFNYMLRVNINLTIVSMVNYTSSEDDVITECNFRQNDSNSDDEGLGNKGEFVWNDVVQSQITGSFYYGYVLTQLPGGRLAEIIGARKVLGVSMGGMALLR
jgi:MFS family permease